METKRQTRRVIFVLLPIAAASLLGFGLKASAGNYQADWVAGTNAAATNFFLGKTGIGTNDPAKQLHVVGDSRLDGGLTVDGAFQVPKQGDVSMGSYTNGVSDQGVVSSNLALRGVWISYDGANQGIYVASNGNVGVGTSSPDAALQVNGSVTVTSNLVVQGVIQGTATNAAALQGHGAADFYPANNPSNWISHASSDGKTYGSKNGTWSEMTATGGGGNFTNPSPVDLVISNANLLVGPTAGSPNSANVLVLSATSAPSNSPEGVVQLWAETIVNAQPSGGTITTSGIYRIHKFNTSSSFSVPVSGTCDVLIVAGGGGGGGEFGGGGGGGGVIATNVSLTSGVYSVTIGAGGAGGPNTLRGSNGANSVFFSLTAFGGGGGGGKAPVLDGSAGGSGGGSRGGGNPGGAGTNGQGYAGGAGGATPNYGCGGGGGGGSVGTNGATTVGGKGGTGYASSISGTLTNYAGGGGGGTYNGGTAGAGGAGGGGNAGAGGGDNPGQAGRVNTGGGGGGASGLSSGSTGGAGGSGIVIVRYVSSELCSWGQELRVRDSSGNVTTLSPHNTSLIPTNITARQEFPMTYYSKNDKLGLEMNVDLLSFIRDYEKMSGKQYIYVRQLNGSDKSVVTNSDVLVKPTKE